MSESQNQPPAQAPPAPPPWWAQPPRKRSWVVRALRLIAIVLVASIFAVSILLNVQLLVLLGAKADWGLKRTVLQDGRRDQVVAVYTIEGGIDDDTAEDFRRFHYAVRDDANVKAVVIRVNSPGGSASASDEIYKSLRSIRTDLGRPVVISMGGVAASGGYYVAMGGQKVYAEPNSITGSIGAVAIWPVFKNFLDKHGVEVVTVRSEQARLWKAKPNIFETPEDRVVQNIRDLLTELDDRFIAIVKEGRGEKLKTRQAPTTQPDDYVEIEPLSGKVYLAQQAKEFGLVDEIGYLEEAWRDAAALAALDRPKVVSYSKAVGLRALMGFSPSPPPIDARAIDRLMSPRVLLMWKVQ